MACAAPSATPTSLFKLVEITNETRSTQKKVYELFEDSFLSLMTWFDSGRPSTLAYEDILMLFSGSLRTPLAENTFSYIAYSQDDTPQAMVEFWTRDPSDTVAVSKLITAPWNLPTTLPLPEKFSPLKVKGAGTFLMNATIEKARSLGKAKLSLVSIRGSEGFYEKIGMRSSDMSAYRYELSLT